MSEAVLVACISGLCTLFGSLIGVVTSARLTTYRIKQLENKVARHNQIIERTFRLEGRMDECEHEVRDLKEFHRPH